MKYQRFYVDVIFEDGEALKALAEREFRDPRKQVAFLIHQALHVEALRSKEIERILDRIEETDLANEYDVGFLHGALSALEWLKTSEGTPPSTAFVVQRLKREASQPPGAGNLGTF